MSRPGSAQREAHSERVPTGHRVALPSTRAAHRCWRPHRQQRAGGRAQGRSRGHWRGREPDCRFGPQVGTGDGAPRVSGRGTTGNDAQPPARSEPDQLPEFNARPFANLWARQQESHRHADLGRRMLKAAARSSHLAFGIQGFAPDEHFSGTQPNSWTHYEQYQAKRCKNHLSPRFRTKIHLCEPASQPDATGFSTAEPDAITANPSHFAKDFIAEHSSSGTVLAQDNPLIGSIGPQALAKSKSVQP